MSQNGNRLSSWSEMLAIFAKWRRDGVLCDVTIKTSPIKTATETIEGVSIPVHKVYLAFRSEVFRSKFEEYPSAKEFLVVSVEPANLVKFIGQIYGEDSVCPTELNVERLYTDAEFLGFKDIQQIALDFMLTNINADSWAKRMKFCKKLPNSDLQKRTYAYISSNFLDCLRSPHFQTLNLFQVMALLRLREQQTISCPVNENEIFIGILKWVCKSPTARADYLEDVLTLLPLGIQHFKLPYNCNPTEAIHRQCDVNCLFESFLVQQEAKIIPARPSQRVPSPHVLQNAESALASTSYQTPPGQELKNPLQETMQLSTKPSSSFKPPIFSKTSKSLSQGTKRPLEALCLESTDQNTSSLKASKSSQTKVGRRLSEKAIVAGRGSGDGALVVTSVMGGVDDASFAAGVERSFSVADGCSRAELSDGGDVLPCVSTRTRELIRRAFDSFI